MADEKSGSAIKNERPNKTLPFDLKLNDCALYGIDVGRAQTSAAADHLLLQVDIPMQLPNVATEVL